ncbi:MAG: hypothetical protein LAN59_03085 [Acidobacteriia bacterium]|nr:hypothetical protein [Terriglobia bacterium]
MSSVDTAQVRIGRAQKRALALGVVGFLVAVILGWTASQKAGAVAWQAFVQSYIFAYVFWVAIPLGCLAILMLHHLTGGWWGLPIRRILEAGSRTLLLMGVLFIPILAGLSRLYSWARPEVVKDDVLLQHKLWYLTTRFFTLRAVIYFAIWVILASFLNRWSAEQDRTGDRRFKDRMEALAGPGLVLWGLTVTGAAIDWVMSLDPHWYSTIYGMIFMVIGCLAAMSFSVVVLSRLSDSEPLMDCVQPKRFLDIGNLMLAFVMLWTYMSFSQFLIIWSGNLRSEIPWYQQRVFGKWAPIAVTLLVLHFFVPFLLLLQRGVKRRLHVLSRVAGLLLVLTLVDIYWLLVPSYETLAPQFRLLDIFAVMGIGGVWLAAFLGQLKKLPLLPLHDPRFEGVLEHGHGD